MMTDLQDIIWASSCHLTDLDRMTLQLHACIAWEYCFDSRKYDLLLNVFNIKCNEVLNITMII